MPQTYTDELPQELPAEVVALGEPARTFAPAAGSPVNPLNFVATVLSIIVALLTFGMAIFFFTAYLRPFGVHPPPRGVALGGALVCATIGSVFLGVAFWYGGRSFGASRRAYLIFDDVLVELLPDRHRILPWAGIGRIQRPHAWAKAYTFSVDGDDPVTFDETMTDHAALAGAIGQATIAHRVTSTLAPGQTLESLRSATPAPYFLAHTITWSGNSSLYRISPVGNCVLFLKVLEGGYKEDLTPAAGGGLVGAIAAYLPYQNYLKLKEALHKLSQAEPYELLAASGDYEGSFAIANADVRAVRITPLTSWQRLCGCKHGGRLELDLADEPLAYDLETPADALKAAAQLCELLANTARVASSRAGL